MNYSPMQSVAEFHDKFHRDGKGRHERPISVSTVEVLERRRKLIEEEFRETEVELEAYKNWVYYSMRGLTKGEDIATIRAHLAKELADLLYVVYGTAEELGIPLEEVFKEVHSSNMRKIWSDGEVHYNEIGKVLKPPTYAPPNIGKILYGE